MLINAWYAPLEAAELGTTPQRARMLGQDFVLYRDAQGVAHCLSDICIHRGASLAEGRVQGDTVECPYHGWRFAGSGACTRIPSLGDEVPIPRRARVDAYPVAERYGLIWCFLGDQPEAERPPLPDLFPEYDDRATWRVIHGAFRWDANWTRVVENGIDVSHAHFVHPDFGDRDNAKVEDYSVESHTHGAISRTFYPPRPKRGLLKLLLRKRTKPVGIELGVHMSGPSSRLSLQMNDTMRMVIFAAHLPVDETTTLSRWVMARNFLHAPMFDKDARQRVMKIFGEDATIIQRVKPVVVPDGLADELTVRSDSLGFTFRKMVREQAARGYEIDSKRLADDQQRDKSARVIPSPARALDPHGWVLKPVPLTSLGPLPDTAEAAE